MPSSRTPEGRSGCCPTCQAQVVIEPSVMIGDATCPACGALLWFFQTPDKVRAFESGSRDHMVGFVAQQLGIDVSRVANNPNLLADVGADSLDTLELVMELEEELELL